VVARGTRFQTGADPEDHRRRGRRGSPRFPAGHGADL